MSESECRCSSGETGESSASEERSSCGCGCSCCSGGGRDCGCSCCGGGGKAVIVRSSCGDWAWPLAILGLNLGIAYLFRDEIAGILAAIRMKIETCCAESKPAPNAAPPKPAAEKAAPTRTARKK